MKDKQIQGKTISYIYICDGTKCSNDWRRTHAHIKNGTR